MKHIRKRFLIHEPANTQLDSEQYEFYDAEGVKDQALLKKRNGELAFLYTTQGDRIGGFVHQADGKYFVFPMPDLTLVYFNNAQRSLDEIRLSRQALLQKVDVSQQLQETAEHELYHFYGTVSGFVIFLFTSIESFINQMIPDDFKFERPSNRNTEIFNKNQIQEFIDFKTKITTVLTEATGNNFFHSQTKVNQMIWNLKEFRDQIIHTKQDDQPLKYDKIIKKSLSFKYEDALYAVVTFMNFYKPDYIVECGCGRDF
jgi:hypothetical protein